MAKIPQVSNGDLGKTAREAFNQAMKTAETDSTMTGTGEVATPLGVDTAWLTTFVDASESAIPAIKSYTFKSKASNGVEYVAGYYESNAADANLTQASTTQTFGSANVAYGAHAFIVAGGAGSTDGSDLVLTVSGTSITDAGVRTPADSEVVVADCTASSTNQYAETSKKWIGQITYTLSSTGGTAFNFDFNFGIAKYDDMNNSSFQVVGFECVGEASANDTGFNLTLLAHDNQGWTYSAAAFTPGGTVLADMNTDYATETDLVNNEYFAYKRDDINTLLDGTASEGVVVKVTTGANNAVDYMDCHITFLFTTSIIT